MGQYYTLIIKRKDQEPCELSHRGYKSGYEGLKLTEHSWIGNEWMDAMAYLIYQCPSKILHFGDYCEDEDFEDLNPEAKEVWKARCKNDTFPVFDIQDLYNSIGNPSVIKFDYEGKYLCNHDQMCYIDMSEYMNDNKDKDGWILHPLALLTAVGNGKGGGDYSGPNESDLATWAWDEVSIEDTIPEGYSKEEEYSFFDN